MFGDSITQGVHRGANKYSYGITSPPNGARVNGSYGPQLESLLRQTERSYAYNWGSAGERTHTAVGRINRVLASRQADFILILEGANDLLWRISPSSTKTNLGILIDKSRAAGIEPIISEITPLTCPDGCGRMGQVNILNNMVIDLAAEKHVILSKVLTQFQKGWNSVPYQSGDGIHLSRQGYTVMANAWHKAILKAVQSEKGSIIPIITPLLLSKS